MGGNALKNVLINRMDKDTYEILKVLVIELFKDYKLEFLFNLDDKESFGDLDVLYCNDTKYSVIDILKEKYESPEIYANGNIISFAMPYEGLMYQIDMISTTNFELSKFYLSYGVTGAIIGRMTNKHNLKYGDRGLSAILPGKILSIYDVDASYDWEPKHIYATIKLTKDVQIICDFLGLDYERWTQGFKNNEELFDWICSCHIYSPRIYENMNLDGKRQQYLDFIEYSIDRITVDLCDTNFCTLAIETFNIEEQIIDLIAKLKIQAIRKKKFNGNIVIKEGIVNQDIGKCIKYIKESVISGTSGTSGTTEDFDTWLDKHDEDYILQYCKNKIAHFKTI